MITSDICPCHFDNVFENMEMFKQPNSFATRQAPLSMGFPWQECWRGLPFPSPGDLPKPGIKPTPPAVADGFFTTEPPGKSQAPPMWIQLPSLLL